MSSTIPELFVTPLLLAVLFRLAVVDLRSRRLPDALTLPLIVAGLILAALRDQALPVTEIWGALAGFGVFAAIGHLFYRWRGVDGLGLGDAKLLGAAGAWLGWTALPVLVLGAALGALAAAWWSGLDRRRQISFGPWLALAFAAIWLARLFGASLPGSLPPV